MCQGFASVDEDDDGDDNGGDDGDDDGDDNRDDDGGDERTPSPTAATPSRGGVSTPSPTVESREIEAPAPTVQPITGEVSEIK